MIFINRNARVRTLNVIYRCRNTLDATRNKITVLYGHIMLL